MNREILPLTRDFMSATESTIILLYLLWLDGVIFHASFPDALDNLNQIKDPLIISGQYMRIIIQSIKVHHPHSLTRHHCPANHKIISNMKDNYKL